MRRRRRTKTPKFSCLGTLGLWVLLFFMFISNDSSTDKAPTAGATPSVGASAFVENVFDSQEPSIAGSNAKDIIKAFERQGIVAPEAQSYYTGGYHWSSSPVRFGDTTVIYDIVSASNYEICSARFYSVGPAVGFLPAAAMLPYDQAQNNEAKAFVQSFKGTEITRNFGDAQFTVSPHSSGNGAILSIEAVGYDQYLYDHPPEIPSTKTVSNKSRIVMAETVVPKISPTATPTLRVLRSKPTEIPENVVWVSRTGEKYHMIETCSDMSAPLCMAEETAISNGRTPCSKCVPSRQH